MVEASKQINKQQVSSDIEYIHKFSTYLRKFAYIYSTQHIRQIFDLIVKRLHNVTGHRRKKIVSFIKTKQKTRKYFNLTHALLLLYLFLVYVPFCYLIYQPCTPITFTRKKKLLHFQH